jgi:hypothetical protein
VVDSGGVNEYLAALGSQAGEDFAWVNMLWLDPTPRRLAFTLYETFIVPWGADGLAAVTVLTAAIGAALAIVTDRRTVMLLLVAFGPYAVLHLLFQETLTIRYALPTLVPVAWLAARALTARGGLWQAAPAVLVVAAMTVSLPTGVAYGREAHPAFRAIHDARFDARVDPPGAVYSHYGIWRSLQADPLPSMVEPSRQREWMGPATYWRDGGTRTVWFLADPRRTDLALIDPLARRDVRSYRWAVGDRRELGGTRPLGVDWYRLSPPGWFAGDGWSLTPETGGLASATGATPDVRPIEAWVRRRTGPLHLMVGGRHLGEPGAPDADFELALDGVVMDRWTLSVAQRNFVRFLDLPEGLPPQTAQYARLTILSRARGGDGQRAPVAVRQFDVQGSDRLIWAFGEGWHEAEYDVLQGRQWRWTSERSILLLSGASGDLRLSLRGESPLRYLDAPPAVRVLVGGRLVGQFRPAADFDWVVTVPLADLTRGEGAIVVETDPVYLPGVAEGTADERHLGLRVYETRLDPVTP